MTRLPAFPLPVVVDWPRVEGIIDEAALQWWWVTSLVEAGDRRFGTLFFLIRSGNDSVEFKASLTDLDTGVEVSRRDQFPAAEVSFAENRVGLSAPGVSFEGSPDEGYSVRVELPDGDGFALSMQSDSPMIFNCGAGVFSGWGSTSKQYALGGMRTAGAVRLAGEQSEVAGASWYDRQWSGEGTAVVPPPGPFTWMGMWLENGVTISLWDGIQTAADPGGKSWATVVRTDGTHIVAPLSPLKAGASGSFRTGLGHEVPGGWTISLSGADMVLELRQTALQEDSHRGFFTGALDVVATCAGEQIRGRGIAELVRWHK